MANATPTRIGVVNGAVPSTLDEARTLFLEKFSGEVLTAFEEKNVMKDLHMSRTIESGKGATFPAMWKTDAGYHTPGTPLLGTQSMKHAEKLINVDSLLVSDIFLANVDEAMQHYDVRSEYTKQMGAALAKKFDTKTMQVAALAARAAGIVDGAPGGSRVTHANNATDGQQLANSLFVAAQTFDEKDIDEEGRSVILKPAQYYLMAQVKDLINKDWGGSGMYSDGTINMVAGFPLIKSNNVPSTVVAADAEENNVYSGDFTTTTAIVLHRSSIGTVKLMDLATQMTSGDFEVMYQGTLLVAKYLMGHGILNPAATIEIATGAV
jgi:hypothetical protein